MEKELFVSCAEGLELLLVQELAEFGFKSTASYRGVYVADSSLDAIYRINYQSRLASRVLLPLSRFPCKNRDDLYRGANQIDWLRYISKRSTFAIDANVQHPALRNSLFAAQVVKDAICDQFNSVTGRRPNVDIKNPDFQLNLFIQNRMATISLDTSGAALHRRGYRQEGVEAPIRENLAAALFRLAEFNPEDGFFDPFCGSGTLLIESILIATHTPPGFLRQKWGFMGLQDFSQSDWLKVKAEVDASRRQLPEAPFIGLDNDMRAIKACSSNLRAAGWPKGVEVLHQDFRDYTPIQPVKFLITNPPHGKRLGDVQELKSLYRAIGDFMKKKMAKPSHGFVFTSNLELAKEVGLAAKRKYPLDSGGEPARLLAFDIY